MNLNFFTIFFFFGFIQSVVLMEADFEYEKVRTERRRLGNRSKQLLAASYRLPCYGGYAGNHGHRLLPLVARRRFARPQPAASQTFPAFFLFTTYKERFSSSLSVESIDTTERVRSFWLFVLREYHRLPSVLHFTANFYDRPSRVNVETDHGETGLQRLRSRQR